ncbi:hypothetical protein GGR16_000015 [Chelatococcus caeni]|uniref:Uncharacterized protein n=1 Tax=Chelatococcus caeni TaxID=1348468 RepID=A0A840BUE4_9HYPH|nr:MULTISPECIES: hypothetical protein [Chelatococcus]MBB4015009.1 hypothetical protein [Chelatococcus caeni]
MKATISGILLALALVVVGPIKGQAQEAPTEAQVAEGLSFEIPAIWSVESLTIQATQNVGSIVDPDIRMRIRATARLQQATFGFVSQIDDVTVLAPVLPEGHVVELFGFASARLYRGEWEYSFDFQGSPFEGSGAPRSSFSGRTVLRDSHEHRAVIAEAEARQRSAREAQQAAIDRDSARLRHLLGRGEFRGESSQGGSVWPFEVVDVVLDANDRFTGQLTWLTLSSVQRINGIITNGMMIFENVEDIQRGDAVLNCVYRLALDGRETALGGFSDCAQGLVQVAFYPEEVIAERRARRAAGIVILRDALAAGAAVQARYDEPDRWGCARLPCGKRTVSEFTITFETFDPNDNLFSGESLWSSGSRYAIEGRIDGETIAFRETDIRENPSNRAPEFQSYHGRIGAESVTGIVCRDAVIDAPCRDPYATDTRFSFAFP